MTTASRDDMETRWRSASRIAQGLLARLPNGLRPVRCQAGGVIYTLRRTGTTRSRLGPEGFYTEFFPKDTIITATVGTWTINRRIRAGFETERFLRLCRYMYYAAQEQLERGTADEHGRIGRAA